MISKDELREYRKRSGLSYRDVATYCDISYQLIEMIENGKKGLTEYNYKEIIRGINGARFAKAQGKLKKKETKEVITVSDIKSEAKQDNEIIDEKI